jgi:hypothetical protein
MVSVAIRAVSASDFATPWAIPRTMPACVAKQTRAASDVKANHAFQGARGLYISKSLSVRYSELSATIGDLGTYDNEVCCLLFKYAREFFQGNDDKLAPGPSPIPKA